MGKMDRANPFNQWRKGSGVSTTEAYDQFGRNIGVGDFLILEAHGAVIWRVTNTKPVLTTNAPPGLVELTMAAVTQVGVQGGAPMAGFIKVRDALEYMTPEQLEGYTREQRQGAPDGGGGEGSQPGVDGPRPDASGEPPPSPEKQTRIILP